MSDHIEARIIVPAETWGRIPTAAVDPIREAVARAFYGDTTDDSLRRVVLTFTTDNS